MKCPRCQHENPPQAKFCLECGVRVALTCTKCRSELPAGAKYCLECGEPVASPATVEPRFASPEAYTPKHLAEKILTSKAALEGERKQVTVLFADLKGSMELLADRDPEEARKILDPVLERMMEAVHRYEGTVNQVMGDGIMALFGAPLAHEDHAVRACYAALRMQETVKKYADEVRRSHAAVVKIRLGLNSGDVVVRAIGSDLHMDYTAVGQTTHLAARMEQIADPGAIVITPETLALAEGYVEVKSLGPVPVKGLTDPVEVYEVTGAGPARTRLQAGARRGLTRFVGRDAELEQLRRAQQLAGDGHGQVAALVGEAGVGKSRLVYEFTHSHRLQGWLILESASVSYGKATSYLPVIDLLKGYFKIQDRDDLREIREKVTGKLLTLDESLKPTLPAFLALLDVSVDDPGWRALDPGQRRQRTLDAVKRVLLAEARIQPVLLIVEDLHWIDTETQALLDTLTESLPTVSVLVLVNYRPEYAHGWGGKTYYTQIRLDALAGQSVDELLDALLGRDAGLEPLKQALVVRTAGNPFFVEESVRTLLETGALVGERGGYRPVHAMATVRVPATVQAVLAARIDRLPGEAKAVLQAAAVIGKDVPFALLHALADMEEAELRRAVLHLQSSEFLYEVRLFPELEYTFKHALTHEVAYAGVLHERQRALHGRIVKVIETLHGDRLAEHVERAAHHALRGEAWESAVSYASEAGRKAAARRAHREAVTWFEHALAALARLPDTIDRQAQAIDLRLDIRSSLVSLGDFASVPFHLRQAEPLAKALGDQDRQSAIASYLAHCLWAMGQFLEGLEAAQHAVELATRAGHPIRQRSARFVLGEIRYTLGDYEQAIAHFRGNIEAELLDAALRWQQVGPAISSVTNRRWLTQSLAEVGRFTEAIAFGTEAVEIAETADHPYSLINALVGLGFALVRKGDVDRAIHLLERGREVSAGLGFPMWSACATPLAAAYGLTGRSPDAARVLADPLIAPHNFTGSQAESCLVGGGLDQAGRLAVQELEHARTQESHAQEAWALYVLGEIAASREPLDAEAAENHLRQAHVLAVGLGMRPLVAHCHLGLSKLYRRTGKREQAREHLTAATTMYREMGMQFWLEKTEKELGELR